MNDQPMIWTSKGNLPVESLTYSYGWEITPAYIKFSERYHLGDELVKEGHHIRMLDGKEFTNEQGVF